MKEFAPPQPRPEPEPKKETIDPKNPSGLTNKDFQETKEWFELEGKTDTTHLGS